MDHHLTDYVTHYLLATGLSAFFLLQSECILFLLIGFVLSVQNLTEGESLFINLGLLSNLQHYMEVIKIRGAKFCFASDKYRA